ICQGVSNSSSSTGVQLGEDATHDLTGTGFGHIGHKDNVGRFGHRANVFGNQLGEFGFGGLVVEVPAGHHKRDGTVPGFGVRDRGDPGFDHIGWDTRADSISMVDNRWPEILMTSSMRPSIQISSSSSTLAPSPAKNQPRPSSAQ